MKRRDFIKSSGALIGTAALSNCAPAISLASKKGKVIILGAGLSGLAAGYKLKQKGYEVTILEARNRIGGRVFSSVIDKQDNLIMELGAEWVGESHERIKQFCAEFGLKLNDHRFEEHLFIGGKYNPYKSWTYEKEWNDKFKALLDGYRNMNEEQKKEMDKMDWWRYLVNNGITEKDLTIRELIDSTDFGESIRVVSADMAAAEYAESSPANEMDYKIEGGNSRLTEELSKRIGLENIKTAHKATLITQTGNTVKVVCDNGSEFSADKLICAIPTFSVNKIKWEPALPQEKQNALHSLQYARIIKNGLLFNERFWKDEKFSLVTDMPGHYFFHTTQNQKSSKGILTSYAIGEKAQMLQSMTKENREMFTCQSFPNEFGNVKSKLISSSGYYWGNDVFSMGAYAIYGKGQWYTLRPALQKPFQNIHFAGEHLAEWQGFMEGAINSGEDAANEITS
jgi:monoamine oxidase